MKKFKNVISFLITVSMAASLFSVPVGAKANIDDVTFPDEIIEYRTDFEDWTDADVTAIRAAAGQNPTSHNFQTWIFKITPVGKDSSQSLSPVYDTNQAMRVLCFIPVPGFVRGAYHMRFDYRFGTSEDSSNSALTLDRGYYDNVKAILFDASVLKQMGLNWYNIDIKVDVENLYWEINAEPYDDGLPSFSNSGSLDAASMPTLLKIKCETTNIQNRNLNNIPLVDNFFFTSEDHHELELEDSAFKLYDTEGLEIFDLTDVDKTAVGKMTVDFGTEMDADTVNDSNITLTCGSDNIAYDGELSGNVYTIVPTGKLKYGASYTVNISKNVKTAEGYNTWQKSFKFSTRAKVVSFPGELIKYGTDFEQMTSSDLSAMYNKIPTDKSAFRVWTTHLAEGMDGGKGLSCTYGMTSERRSIDFLPRPKLTNGVHHFRFDFRAGTSEDKQNNLSFMVDSSESVVATIFSESYLVDKWENEWYNIDIRVDYTDNTWTATATPYDVGEPATARGSFAGQSLNVRLESASNNPDARTLDNVPVIDNFYHTVETAGDYMNTKILSVTKNGAKLTSVEDCVGEEPICVKVSYANTTDEDKNMSVAIAGYDENNKMISLRLADNLVAESGNVDTLEVKSGAIDESTHMIQIILWDGIATMASYCDFTVLGAVGGGADNKNVTDDFYAVNRDFVSERVNVYGNIDISGNDNGVAAITVLKPGYTFDGLAQLSETEKENAILYTSIQNTKSNKGNFDFTIGYDSDDLASFGGAADVNLRMTANGGAQALDLTLGLVSAGEYKKAVKDLNDKAADETVTDDQFAEAVKSSVNKMQFDFNPFAPDEINGENLSGFRKHIVGNPLTDSNVSENISVLKKYLVIEGIKESKISNIDEYARLLYAGSSELKTGYEDVAVNENIQKYFTSKLTENLKDVVSPDINDFDKAWKTALILTTAYYGNGYGSLKNVLNLFGSEIGISGTVYDEVCRNLIGKEYTVSGFKSAYSSALSNMGGGSGGGGGGQKNNSSVGIYKMDAAQSGAGSNPILLNFTDIDGVGWASEAILALADKGIIVGKGNNLFKPYETVTREEFIKILISAMNLSDSSYKNHFADVKDGDWFAKYVNIAYEKGICSGVDSDNFGVGAQITRQDMAVLLYNALKLNKTDFSGSASSSFEDENEIADYAKTAVKNMVSIGALNGVSKIRFAPAGAATRAQAATVIYRVLGKLQ